MFFEQAHDVQHDILALAPCDYLHADWQTGALAFAADAASRSAQSAPGTRSDSSFMIAARTRVAATTPAGISSRFQMAAVAEREIPARVVPKCGDGVRWTDDGVEPMVIDLFQKMFAEGGARRAPATASTDVLK